jgi:hypothetical protein
LCIALKELQTRTCLSFIFSPRPQLGARPDLGTPPLPPQKNRTMTVARTYSVVCGATLMLVFFSMCAAVIIDANQFIALNTTLRALGLARGNRFSVSRAIRLSHGDVSALRFECAVQLHFNDVEYILQQQQRCCGFVRSGSCPSSFHPSDNYHRANYRAR